MGERDPGIHGLIKMHVALGESEKHILFADLAGLYKCSYKGVVSWQYVVPSVEKRGLAAEDPGHRRGVEPETVAILFASPRSGKTVLAQQFLERALDVALDRDEPAERYAEQVEERGAPRVERDEVEGLKRERDTLFVQNQMLQSRVQEERRAAARATRMHDQLLARFDKLLSSMTDRDKAVHVLQQILLAREAGTLRMFEAHEGRVEQVEGDRVVVVFETDDDIIEQVYERSQFVDGKLPQVGERLTVFVHGAVRPGQTGQGTEQAPKSGEQHEPARRRKNLVTGPYEF